MVNGQKLVSVNYQTVINVSEKIDLLMYHAGLTAQGCWDEMDEYARTAIIKFAELIVRECMNLVKDCYAEPESGQSLYQTACASTIIEDHFGFEE